MADDGPSDGAVLDLVRDGREFRQGADRDVGPHRIAGRVEQVRELPQQTAVPGHGIAQRNQDLLLTDRPGKITLARALARSNVVQGREAVQVMAALADAVAVHPVRRIVDVGRHHQVHATGSIDHPSETGEADLGVVRDLDAQQRTDSVAQGAQTAVRELAAMTVRVGHQGVQLGPELVAIAERDVDQVARDRDQTHGSADWIERGHHHRVREDGLMIRPSVDPDQQHVDARSKVGSCGWSIRSAAQGGLEHPPERIAERRAVPLDEEVRCAHDDGQENHAGDPEPPGRAGPSGIKERLSDGYQAPRE